MTNPSNTAGARWSVVVPYYNEANGYLEATLQSLITQSARPLVLILVDNNSNDGSGAIARALTDGIEGVEAIHVLETVPGQVHALEAGIKRANTPFLAICDADTVYPPHYLDHAAQMFDAGGSRLVGVMAMSVGADPTSFGARLKRWKGVIVSRILRGQVHTGGYGHCFRLGALRASGGYGTQFWPYVLFDHELIHRVLKQGRIAYSPNLYCQSSDRRTDRANVTWTLLERLLYHFTPFALKDWFFYDFLKKRFAARGMVQAALRQREWENVPTVQPTLAGPPAARD